MLQEPTTDLYKPALESLRTLIRTSTSSMTSVPKPLKFLRPFYADLEEVRKTWPESLASEKVSMRTRMRVAVVPHSNPDVFLSLLRLLSRPSSRSSP